MRREGEVVLVMISCVLGMLSKRAAGVCEVAILRLCQKNSPTLQSIALHNAVWLSARCS